MNKVQTINGLHHEAMEFTGRSMRAKRYGETEEYLRFTRLALEKEAAAADLMVDEDIEPTRSVLHRSAATLAWRCQEYKRAKKLIRRALAGSPPGVIERELTELLGKVETALGNGARQPAEGIKTTDQSASQIGVLKIATALNASECVLITRDDEKWTIELPDELMNEILGEYFNKEVQVVGKRMKRTRLLQRIRVERKDQIRAI